MVFAPPRASKRSVTRVLGYLGNRQKDIKKFTDIESTWFAKYCNLVERGLEPRQLKYAERHHIVPYTWYAKRPNTKDARRWDSKICADNITVLSRVEHVAAHYYLAKCAIGKMSESMSIAICNMLHLNTTLLPSERKFLDTIITPSEVKRLFGNISQSAVIDKEGRTHYWEDPVKAKHDGAKKYYREHTEHVKKKVKAWTEKNPERVTKNRKKYARTHKKEIAEARKRYNEQNPDKVKTNQKNYRERHRKDIKARKAKFLEEHPNYYKEYYATNRERLKRNAKRSRDKYKDKYNRRRREYRAQHAEETKRYARNYYADHPEKYAVYAERRRTKLGVEECRRRSRESYRRNITARRKRNKEIYDAKVKAGYRYRFIPETGKHGWVYVGKENATKRQDINSRI